MLTGERNLIYSAPTGGGKSLVADVLMFNRVLMNQKAILVLPYVALVQEKTSWLRRALEGVEKLIEPPTEQKLRSWRNRRAIRVAGFFGGSKLRETWADIDIAVCTIEKVRKALPLGKKSLVHAIQANSLVNSAIDDGSIDGLGIAVLDELHMIDDENRGYLLELLGTKLLSLERKIQVVGMSATLSVSEMSFRKMASKVDKLRIPLRLQIGSMQGSINRVTNPSHSRTFSSTITPFILSRVR